MTRRVAWVLALGLAGQAMAQLSSPVPGVRPSTPSAPSPASPPTPGSGQGLGYHSPQSPFAQMTPRADTVPWALLGEVKTRNVKNRLLPEFTPGIKGLDQKTQRVQGYMMPLEPGERQRHFLISSVPLTCSFCLPGGPESLIEVRSREPVRYGMEPVVLEGRFEVLADDPQGVYYRMTQAVVVK